MRCVTTAPKFLIVDAVPQHDEQADQELPGHGHPRFGASAPAQKGEVQPLQVLVIPGGDGRGLHQNHTKQGIASLGNLLWQRLLRRPASESGTLCHGDGGHEGATATGGC